MAPDPIRCHDEDGFARETLVNRLPKILNDARTAMPEEAARDSRWEPFLENMIGGGPIALDMLARPTRFWSRYIKTLAGMAWHDLSFFEIEFLFYHAINSRAGWFETGFDVFAATRASALQEALPRFQEALATMNSLLGEERLRALVRRATDGNLVDYSQTAVISDPMAREEGLLVDDTEDLLESLSGIYDAEIHVLADNAGCELCWDLALIDALLVRGVKRAIMHLKPWPMFVSDALPVDVRNTVAAMSALEHGTKVRALGRRLRAALLHGRLRLEAAADWGEPRHISDLGEDLRRRIAEARTVIAKGDLNYRRFVEDRAWPSDAPVADATVTGNLEAYALRVLKSDAVVGIPSHVVAKLDADDPLWRSNGSYAVVQSICRRTGEHASHKV
jgi:hypothetical protein